MLEHASKRVRTVHEDPAADVDSSWHTFDLGPFDGPHNIIPVKSSGHCKGCRAIPGNVDSVSDGGGVHSHHFLSEFLLHFVLVLQLGNLNASFDRLVDLLFVHLSQRKMPD